MAHRLVGTLLFAGIAVFLFDVAGRLASEQRAGWGWFMLAGLITSGVAHNLWTEKSATPRCPISKPTSFSGDLD